MGKTKGKAWKQRTNSDRTNKQEQRTAEALLRRQDTRVTTTVVTDLREALSLAPWTDQVHPRPASSWLAAAHLAQSALGTATGASPADNQFAPPANDKSVNAGVAL